MQSLHARIESLIERAGAEHVGLAFYDFESEIAFSYHGDRVYHAASTMKVPLLAAVFAHIAAGHARQSDVLHVRNRFTSAFDGSPFMVSPRRDANAVVYKAIGQTMSLQDLAYHMTVTSSNLATNLLLDYVGVPSVQALLQQVGASGISVVRGVEDDNAYQSGISNTTTARGLVHLFRALHAGDVVQGELRTAMLDILFDQRFRAGIPRGLPRDLREEARIAHKTGEISTVAHDAGLIYLPKRKPYAVAVLTQWGPNGKGRSALIANLSRALYDAFVHDRDA